MVVDVKTVGVASHQGDESPADREKVLRVWRYTTEELNWFPFDLVDVKGAAVLVMSI